MAKSLTSNLIVALIDRVTGPSAKIKRSLSGLDGAARRSQVAGSLDRIAGSARGLNTALVGVGTNLLAPLAAGYGATRIIGVANSTETALTRLGITAGVSAEQMARAKSQIQGIAPELGVAQGELYRVLETLVAGGLSWGQALEALPQVVKTAKASGTAMEEVAAASIAVMQNLQVPAEQIQKAFDAMVAGGKAGAFELRDMAREFPSIAASAAKVGMTGTEAVADLAAMAQIARKTAGSSSEAANNMVNFFEKLTADTTVKNFAKFGVDITKVFKKAQKDGVSFTDAMLDVIDKITGGDPFKVAQLFPDMQARNFLNAVLANQDELRRLRGEIRNSAGAVEKDFRRVSETTREALNRAGAAVENVAERLGSTLAPAATASADAIVRLGGDFTRFLDDVERRYTVFDRLADKMKNMGSGEPIQIGGKLGKEIDDFFRRIDEFEQKVLGLRPPGEVVDEWLFGKPVTVDRSTEIAAAAMDRVEKLKGEIAGVRDKVAAAEIAAVEATTKQARAAAKAEADGLRAEIARLEQAIADATALAGRMGGRDMTGVEAGQERAGEREPSDAARRAGRGGTPPVPVQSRNKLEQLWTNLSDFADTLIDRASDDGSYIADRIRRAHDAGFGTDGNLEAALKRRANPPAPRQPRPSRPFAMRPDDAAGSFATPSPRGIGTGSSAGGFALPVPRPEAIAEAGRQAGEGFKAGIAEGVQGAAGEAEAANGRIAGAFSTLGPAMHREGLNAALQLAAGLRAGIPTVAAAAADAAVAARPRVGAPAPRPIAIDGARAGGGPIWPGGSFLVGEDGPEVVTPDEPATVHPNGARPAAGAAAAVARPAQNVTIHINGVTDPDAVAERVTAVLDRKARDERHGLFADYGIDAA